VYHASDRSLVSQILAASLSHSDSTYGAVSGSPAQVLAASRKGEPLVARLADQAARYYLSRSNLFSITSNINCIVSEPKQEGLIPGSHILHVRSLISSTSSAKNDATNSTWPSPICSAMVVRARCSTASEPSLMSFKSKSCYSMTPLRSSTWSSSYPGQVSLPVLSSGSGRRPSTLYGR